MRPVACGVRTKPCGGGTVAIFAGYAFRQLEWAAALLGRRVERMTREALRRFFGLRIEFQNTGDAFADISGQCLVRATMLILDNPGGIFVLQNAAAWDGFDAAVTARGGTGAGTDIFLLLKGVASRSARRALLLNAAIFRGGNADGKSERQRQRKAQRRT